MPGFRADEVMADDFATGTLFAVCAHVMTSVHENAVTEIGFRAPADTRWTRNQRRAAALATSLTHGRTADYEMSDTDWALLLLASGCNDVTCSSAVVGRRVLEHFLLHEGYFAAG